MTAFIIVCTAAVSLLGGYIIGVLRGYHACLRSTKEWVRSIDWVPIERVKGTPTCRYRALEPTRRVHAFLNDASVELESMALCDSDPQQRGLYESVEAALLHTIKMGWDKEES